MISAANIKILFLPGGFLKVILPNQLNVIGKLYQRKSRIAYAGQSWP